MNTALYDQDYYLWLEQTVQLLKEGKLSEVDVKNIIEEIEDMGKSQKNALESNLIVLLTHLLKWKYQPEKRCGSWKGSIAVISWVRYRVLSGEQGAGSGERGAEGKREHLNCISDESKPL